MRNLHVPFGMDFGTNYTGDFDHLGDAWYREAIAEEGLPEITQHVYTFPGYSTSWHRWEERMAKMVGYLQSSIVSRTIPALGRPPEPIV